MKSTRGQTLVLLALTMLLLVVAVCLTLAIGTKAKEKIELQTAADQAAWSNAVATARTFNQLAIVNRANIAHYVAMLGVQSTLSMSAAYIGYLDAVFAAYGIEVANSPCGFFSPSCCWKPGTMAITRIIPLYLEIRRANSVLNALDARVALQAQRPLSAAGALFALQVGDLVGNNLYQQKLSGQQLATRVLRQSKGAQVDLYAAPASTVALREVGLDIWPPRRDSTRGALAPAIGGLDYHIGSMVMASRSHPYISNRSNVLPLPVDVSGAYSLMKRQLNRFLAGDRLDVAHLGGAWVGEDWHPDSQSPLGAALQKGVADDHGIGLLRYNGWCPRSGALPILAAGVVRSTSAYSEHKGGLGGSVLGSATFVLPVPLLGYGSDARHRLSMPGSPFPPFVDFNPSLVHSGDDAYGQPKLPVVMVRDAMRQPSPDPWNLLFRFRFTRGGSRLDMHDDSSRRMLLIDGTDASKQVALSSGLVYYHRAGHWAEPPNLFNPFWRAGLTRSDFDASGSTDIKTTLTEAGAGWAGDTYGRLQSRGFVAAP